MFFYLILINYESSLLDKIRISSFNVISILSGTGYVTDDFRFMGKIFFNFFLTFNVYWWLCGLYSLWNKNF